MNSAQFNLPMQQQALDAVSAGIGNTATLHLYKTDITVTNILTKADMDAIEADFDGYAAVALIGGLGNSVFLESLGAWVLQIINTFVATGGTTPNTIYGAYITNSTGENLVAVQRFSQPQGVSATGEAANAFVTIAYNGQPV